ncbi:alpha/beta fold hydrolase [Flammeovirga sp. SJP92]|uniref:alpha/beta fold hydrolase n=1 Tax=Flammeovirga sp. SJP92 TaxID=1775430 RepID=UPI000AC0A4A3|nr:alpha/beta fold hydrolase [Flammeovirga sp. SJP92]
MAIDIIEKYTDEQSNFMELEGMKVHYKVEGEGFPIVLLHGTFSSLHTWDKWTETLKEKYKVIRLDLPGFGITGPRPDRTYSIDIYLNFINTFLKKLEVKKFYLAGSSLGGWIAWEYSHRYKEQVRRLILLNAAGFNDKDSIPLLFKLVQNPIIKEFKMFHGFAEYLQAPKSFIEFFLKNAYGNPKRVDRATITRYHEIFSRKGNKEAFLNIANSSIEDHSDLIKQLDTPTLIIWGEKDRWIPLANAYKFQFSLPNSQLIIYEGVGHVPMEEIPAKSAKDTISFLENTTFDSGVKIQTSYLCDQFRKEVKVASGSFEKVGKKIDFHGQAVCLKTNNPQLVLERLEEENGKGKVLVVEWECDKMDALIDEEIAYALLHQEWEGLITDANYRHTEALNKMRIGILANKCYPMKALKADEPIEIYLHANVGGLELVDGNYIYMDEDGVVSSEQNLVDWEK